MLCRQDMRVKVDQVAEGLHEQDESRLTFSAHGLVTTTLLTLVSIGIYAFALYAFHTI